MMRFIFSVLLFAGFSFSVQSQPHNSLFPQPKQLSYKEGKLALVSLSIAFNTNQPDILFALRDFRTYIEQLTGKPMRSRVSGITLKYVVKRKEEWLPDTSGAHNIEREAYSIKINNKGIQIDANTSTGLFYALQTLKQMVEKVGNTIQLPFAEIVDEPTIPYRGVMMDFAHGGLPKVDEIKRQLDVLSFWKANQYYFYNEISIALNGYEGLNYKQGYSQSEIKEIIAYGKERHIDVIPFMAFYGHLHDLLKQERYASLAIGNYGHELDPRKKEVGMLLKDWIAQYAKLFSSPFIHVGFDETWETARMAKETDTSLHSETLWLLHLKNIREELKKYGKTVLAWTDMSAYYPDILSKFPKDVIPVIWEYSPDSVALYNYLAPVLKADRKFFIQPAVSGWGHIYPAMAYTYDNIDLCLRTGMREKTLGFITSVWTDAVEPFVRPSLPFMSYGCVAAWQGTSPNRQTFEKKYANMLFGDSAASVQKACTDLADAVDLLQKVFGKNTSNMPGGTIIESWSNPFDPYYTAITSAKSNELKAVRIKCEEAEEIFIRAIQNAGTKNKDILEALRVTAKLMHYEATRFLWANVMAERWNKAMLEVKQNNFVYYDIAYLCHGLIQDVMDELSTLKEDYAAAWLSENLPYRKNTILSRFDVEYGLWQKLLLKVIDHRIEHSADFVDTKSFVDVFHPDF